jgi:hypothetical protein
VALVGMREVGMELQSVVDALRHPTGGLWPIGHFAARKLGSLFGTSVSVRSPELENDAGLIARDLSHFGSQVQRLLARYRKEIVEEEYQLGRAADAATELYIASCVLNRLDYTLREAHNGESKRIEHDLTVGRYYLAQAHRRIRRALDELWDNDDRMTTKVADLT